MAYTPEFDDENDSLDAWEFATDFEDIAAPPVARWASDENAGYAT